ncbi:hypothetical protein L3X38_034637 [Prunus dulcis]|uniref:Uncharacterized protein n=1 Tax=Prunus dulcis TaxID=3755 RepID=A0AAD4VIG5_PRUDU|nr:hypothetical protein L3X38_034637 [Prunus dulcis]
MFLIESFIQNSLKQRKFQKISNQSQQQEVLVCALPAIILIPSFQALFGLGDTKSIRAANWQDSGDRSQPDPKSWQVSVTPSQSEPQILALTVPASPKLVRQMSSALKKLRVNWMSVDICITEGNNRSSVLTVV